MIRVEGGRQLVGQRSAPGVSVLAASQARISASNLFRGHEIWGCARNEPLAEACIARFLCRQPSRRRGVHYRCDIIALCIDVDIGSFA